MIVHTKNGNELRRQLERLNGYLRQPKDAVACSTTAVPKGVVAPPGKEDVDASSASLEYGYRGPELDACLNSDDESDPSAVSPDGDDVKGTQAHVALAAVIGADTTAASVNNVEIEAPVSVGVSNTEKGDERGGGFATVTESLSSETSATATVEGPPEAVESGTASASDKERDVGREGRGRELLNAPSVDAEDGVHGWRRSPGGVEQPPKVTIMQDVMSVLFGWEAFAGGKGSRGGNGGEDAAVMAGNRNGAGIMFA